MTKLPTFKRPMINKTLYASSNDRWSGYSSKTRKFGNSGFWMSEDEDQDIKYVDPGSRVDVIKLAGYLRAISNFVRIVTNSDNIKVRFDSKDRSYTDGQEVVISSKLDEKGFDSTVGLALHEGSHVLLTDFKWSKNFFQLIYQMECYGSADEFKFTGSQKEFIDYIPEWLLNSELAMKHVGMLKDILNVVEDRRIDNYIYKSAPGYRGYYEALYNRYFNSKDIDTALANNLYVEQTMQCYMFHLINITNANRNLNALPGLNEIWHILNLPKIGRLKSTQDAAKCAIEIYKVIIDNLDVEAQEAQQSQGQGNGKGEEQGDGQGNGPGNTRGQEVNEDDNNGPGNGSDSGADTQANLSPKDLATLAKAKEALKEQRDFLNGDIKKKKLSGKDASRVQAAAESGVHYQAVGGSVETGNGNTKEQRAGKINCVVLHGWNDKVVTSGLVSAFIDSRYRILRQNEEAKAAGKDLPHSEESYYLKSYMTQVTQEDNPVTLGVQLGSVLGKRLKTRDEERSLVTTRLDAGKIDRRLIAELGYGVNNVFSQILHSKVVPSIIHLSIDASGSMSGSRWDSAIKTAVAIAKAGSMVQTMDVVISLRGVYENSGSGAEALPMIWVVYDSRKQNFNSMIERFKGLTANGSTPEGLCYEAISNEVIKDAAGKNAYLINFSDGEPAFSGKDFQYHGDYAMYHTRKQVMKMQSAGINVLSYFISDYDSLPTRECFKTMYPNSAEFINVSSLSELSRSLNKLFERGVE